MSGLPHIPDSAFDETLSRIGRMLDVIPPNATPEQVQEITNNFYRALGLDGEYDPRALGLVSAVLAHLRQVDSDTLDPTEISVGVLGISLGLLLARGTGWEPPMSEDA